VIEVEGPLAILAHISVSQELATKDRAIAGNTGIHETVGSDHSYMDPILEEHLEATTSGVFGQRSTRGQGFLDRKGGLGSLKCPLDRGQVKGFPYGLVDLVTAALCLLRLISIGWKWSLFSTVIIDTVLLADLEFREPFQQWLLFSLSIIIGPRAVVLVLR
jgi:hypothetical protein